MSVTSHIAEVAIVVAAASIVFVLTRMFHLSASEQARIREAIRRRSGDDEKALNYIQRQIDRQINKVRGVLTFNGIFLAVVRVPFADPSPFELLMLDIATAALLISIGLSLWLFFVEWGDARTYDTFEKEFTFRATYVEKRTVHINYTVTLSMLAALAIAALAVSRHYRL